MKDEAIHHINDAIKEDREGGPYPYLSLINNPFYDNLRDDPRFKQIIKKQKRKYEERLKKYGNL